MDVAYLRPYLKHTYHTHLRTENLRKCSKMEIFICDNFTLYTSHFADDQITLAKDKKDLKYITQKLIEEYPKPSICAWETYR